MVEIIFVVMSVLSLGLGYSLGRRRASVLVPAFQAAPEVLRPAPKPAPKDVDLGIGDRNSPTVLQMNKRIALAENLREHYKEQATHKHAYHERQLALHKEQIDNLTVERNNLAAQVQQLQNPKPDPITGNQGVMY